MSHVFECAEGGLALAAMVLTGIVGRVACQLLSLAEQNNEIHVSVQSTDDDFADHVGTSTQTLNKILRDFEDRNWVSRQMAAVAVLDRPALERLADQTPPSD